MTTAPTAPPSKSAADYAIDLAEVAKTYRGKIRALRGIEMRVHRGEVFGLLGPNGAGKSTLVKILMTVISPSRCRGTVLGDPVGRKSTLARVGYLPEHHRFPSYLKGGQVVDFYGAMTKTPRKERRRRAGELLDLVGMGEWAETPIRKYSKGMRQRIGIAQALINDPDLVLLDEPTDGVDPAGRREIRNIVKTLRDQGRTVFINSHLLSELEMVCDRVAILLQGVVQSQGTIDELTDGKRGYELVVTEQADNIDTVLTECAGPLAGATTRHPPGTATITAGLIPGTAVRLNTEDAAAVQPIIDRVRSRGLTVAGVRPVRPSLEDLYMAAIEASPMGAAPGAREAIHAATEGAN